MQMVEVDVESVEARGYLSMLEDGSLGALPKEAGAAVPRAGAGLTEMEALIQSLLDAAPG